MHLVHVHEVPPVDPALEVEEPRLPEAMQNWNLGLGYPCFVQHPTHLGRPREDVRRDEPVGEENITKDLVRITCGDRGQREVPGEAALGVRDEVVALVEELGGPKGDAAEADLTRGRRHRPYGEVVVEIPAKTCREGPSVARANDSVRPTLGWVVRIGREWCGSSICIPNVAEVLVFVEVDVLCLCDEGRVESTNGVLDVVYWRAVR